MSTATLARRPGRLSARAWLGLAWFGATTVALRRHDPLVGSLIVTDRCNLACQHCAVANIRRVDYSFPSLCADMRTLREQGVRILFLYGGEPMLWRDGARRLPDVIAEARAQGFVMVNVVTNGTRGLDLPGADVVLVSLDGTREHHDQLRGHTYDVVMRAIASAPVDNLCLYMAVNRVNAGDIGHVCRLARDTPHVRGVAFNLHTPYPGTEHLSLTDEARRTALATIRDMIDAGYPVMDLRSTLSRIADGTAPRPCAQCVIIEDGQQWTCGRCIEVPGLCAQCGFLFASELSLLFRGDPAVVRDALRVYGRAL